MTKQLHNIGLAEGTQPREQGRLAAQLAEAGILDQSTVSVEQTTAQAPDLTLDGRLTSPPYRNLRMVAAELRELGNSALGAVPLFRTGSESFEATGYYEVQTTDASPAHSVARDTVEYTIALKRAGTRKSNYRAVAVSKETRSHPFGSTSTADLAVPQSAKPTLRWYNTETGETSRVAGKTDVTTAQGILTDISLSGRPSDKYALAYDVPYADDPVGVRAYDSRGNADKFDSENTRQWQTLYETQHDVGSNAIILSNGRVRLRLAEADSPDAGSLEWAEHSGSWGSWSDITPTDYDPVDLDITNIDQQRIDAQILFRDLSVSTDDYAVDVTLSLGFDKPLFVAAEGESSGIPSDIQTALDPAARDSEVDPRAGRTLVDRAEVRR